MSAGSSRAPAVVVLTGASSGVGRATARAFAERGDRLVLLSRGGEGLEGARADAEAHGAVAVLAVPTDVADAEAVEEAAVRAEREVGAIDVWVNDAMLSVFSEVKHLRADEVRRVTEATYLGTVNGTLSALQRMLPRDRGTIVQVGSALAYRAIPLQAAYCGAKHAIRGFTDSLRCELLHDGSGVSVTQVHLPALNTPQFEMVRSRLPRHPQPVPPIYQPEVAARAILRAADHPTRERWIGRATIMTVLANRIAPALLDRYLARTGYGSQQTSEPVAPDRPDNLDGPLPGDPGAHGRFDDRAQDRSITMWLRDHAAAIGVAGAAGAAVGAAALAREAAR